MIWGDEVVAMRVILLLVLVAGSAGIRAGSLQCHQVFVKRVPCQTRGMQAIFPARSSLHLQGRSLP